MSFTTAEFCDTNIFVYAYDDSSGRKGVQARELVQRLWSNGNGALSVQVLQELYVTLTRKIPIPLQIVDARSIVKNLSTWKLVETSSPIVLEAIDESSRWQISFWDGLILAATRRVGAPVLWSEDLGDGQDYDGVIVHNPFRR